MGIPGLQRAPHHVAPPQSPITVTAHRDTGLGPSRQRSFVAVSGLVVSLTLGWWRRWESNPRTSCMPCRFLTVQVVFSDRLGWQTSCSVRSRNPSVTRGLSSISSSWVRASRLCRLLSLGPGSRGGGYVAGYVERPTFTAERMFDPCAAPQMVSKTHKPEQTGLHDRSQT